MAKITNDYTKLTDQELSVHIADEQMRLKKLKFAHAISPIENPMTINAIRKDIARMLTEQTNRK